jgi:hypothetical protein
MLPLTSLFHGKTVEKGGEDEEKSRRKGKECAVIIGVYREAYRY